MSTLDPGQLAPTIELLLEGGGGGGGGDTLTGPVTIDGALTVTDHSAIGADATVDEQILTNFYDSYTAILTVAETDTTVSPDFIARVGQQGAIIYEPAADSSAEMIGMMGLVVVPNTVNITDGGEHYGTRGFVQYDATGSGAALFGMTGDVIADTPDLFSATGAYGSVNYRGGTVGFIAGVNSSVTMFNAATNRFYNHVAQSSISGTSTIGELFGYYMYPVQPFAPAAVTTIYGVWIGEQTHGTNNYYFWSDGAGVTRIKEEGATKGGVYAWYNPTFTKYTPGATNFERGVLQWNTGDVCEVGAEAGGTGTQRTLRLLSRKNTATYDPASLNTLTGATTTITVTGAALGDFVLASFSLDLQGVMLSAWVSSANTVSVRFFNSTAGTVDLGSGTISVTVLKP